MSVQEKNDAKKQGIKSETANFKQQSLCDRKITLSR
jgi:hypothetical protein